MRNKCYISKIQIPKLSIDARNRLFLVMWHFQLHFVVQFSKRGRKNMETWKSILSVCCCLLTTLGRKVVFLIRPKSSVLIRVCNASSTLVEPYKREIQCRYFVSYRKSCCIHYNTRNTTSTLSLLKNKWKAFSRRIICAMQNISVTFIVIIWILFLLYFLIWPSSLSFILIELVEWLW